jgi:hypothetical protein
MVRIPTLYLMAFVVIVIMKALIWGKFWKILVRPSRRVAFGVSIVSPPVSWIIDRIVVGALNPALAAVFPDFLFICFLSVVIELWIVVKIIETLEIRRAAIWVAGANAASFAFLFCWNNIVFNYLLK